MAEKKSLFRKESLDRMQSPEKIDEYIRVSTPKAWILVAALVLIVAGVVVWGFVGSIPKTITANGAILNETVDGITYNDDAVCLLPVNMAGQYLVGHDASVTLASGETFPGTVFYVREDPFSYEEVAGLARSDWRLQTMWGEGEGNYRYALAVHLDKSGKELPDFGDRELVTVTVVLSDVKPIEYVLN